MKARDAARRFSPDILIVALGLDTSADDPFACMAMDEQGFCCIATMLGALRRPTLIVREGGCSSPSIVSSLGAFPSGFTRADIAASCGKRA